MAEINLNRQDILADDGNESIVIVRDLADIPGGRALDVTGFDGDIIQAGHIIKRVTADDTYAPLDVTGDNYAELAGGEEYVGVLKCSVSKDKPAASILTMGQVNAAACPYPVTAAIKAGLPQIKFIN